MRKPLLSPGFDPSRLTTPATEPAIHGSIRALSTILLGETLDEVEPGSKEFSTRQPFIATRSRIRDGEAAERLQLSYHALHKRFIRPSPVSQRLALLNHTFQTGDGVLHVMVKGLLADWTDELVRFDEHGERMDRDEFLEMAKADSEHGVYDATRVRQLTRLCLDAPISAGGEHPDVEMVDSHLWLDSSKLVRFEGGVGPKALHIGEYVTVDAHLRAYRDRHGNRRLGVDLWQPVESSVEYTLTDADGRDRQMHVPSHLVKRMRVVKLDDDEPRWADPRQLQAEVDRLRRRWPQESDELQLLQ